MNSPRSLPPDQVGRQGQLIIGSLMMGLLMFAGVVLLIGGQGAPNPILPLIAGLTGVGAIPAALVVPTVMLSNNSRQPVPDPNMQPSQLAMPYLSATIVRGAILEGAAFFNLIAVLITGHSWCWMIPVLSLLMMAATFPSQTKFEEWVESIRRQHV
jgi:1,4-dihydroxy-2-naphthoate octaprenyltransferase